MTDDPVRRALVVTSSTRAAAGVWEDRSGPVVAEGLTALGLVVIGPVVVADGEPLREALLAMEFRVVRPVEVSLGGAIPESLELGTTLTPTLRGAVAPILTGVLVSAEGTALRMVATDSYRLSVKETTLEAPLAAGFEANVPARALEELGRLTTPEAETISIGVRANQVVFAVGDVTLSSRLIDGQFPNYRQLLPDQFEHELTLDTAEFLEVVERISLMAQKNAPLRLSFSEGELRISAQTPDVGEASDSFAVPFAGEPFEIGFNPEFLTAGLQSAAADKVILKLISPLRPGLLESADGSGFLYLIMPIRLNV